MRVTLTAKLKLITTQQQAEQLRRTALGYRDALNHTSRMAFANGKPSNAMRLQKLVYRDLRTRYGLSAQLACNVPRQVAATYKGVMGKGQAQRQPPQGRTDQKTLQGPGQASHVCINDDHVLLRL